MEPQQTYSEYTVLDGVPLEVKGEVFDKPIYPAADVKLYSRITVHYAKTGQRVGEISFEEQWDNETLIKMVKEGINNPKESIDKVIDKAIIDIIKKSKDYTDEPK